MLSFSDRRANAEGCGSGFRILMGHSESSAVQRFSLSNPANQRISPLALPDVMENDGDSRVMAVTFGSDKAATPTSLSRLRFPVGAVENEYLGDTGH